MNRAVQALELASRLVGCPMIAALRWRASDQKHRDALELQLAALA